MSRPVLVETIADCGVCGEVACERDLVYLDPDEADDLGLGVDEIVCRQCLGAEEEA